MHNKIINLALVAQVAKGFRELNEKMVSIGGAVISLYTDDPAAEEIRPTSDIDLTINLANYYEWVQMQDYARGFNCLTRSILGHFVFWSSFIQNPQCQTFPNHFSAKRKNWPPFQMRGCCPKARQFFGRHPRGNFPGG